MRMMVHVVLVQVVFADADLDKAAQDAVTFSLFNCGQVRALAVTFSPSTAPSDLRGRAKKGVGT